MTYPMYRVSTVKTQKTISPTTQPRDCNTLDIIV